MHNHHKNLLGWGYFFLIVELIWSLVWFAFEIWFNVVEGARPFEQALFDNIVRIVGVIVIIKMVWLIQMHRDRSAKKSKSHKSHHLSWFNVFVIWVVGFIMARNTMIVWQSPFYLFGTNTVTNVEKALPFWQALAAIAMSGLVVTFLELLWVSMVYYHITWNHPQHKHRGVLSWLLDCLGAVKDEAEDILDMPPTRKDMEMEIRATPNISVRGLKK
jgi:hypothetical protein